MTSEVPTGYEMYAETTITREEYESLSAAIEEARKRQRRGRWHLRFAHSTCVTALPEVIAIGFASVMGWQADPEAARWYLHSLGCQVVKGYRETQPGWFAAIGYVAPPEEAA